jgi:threonine dehydrogenase-like Zn-dependent dehydrogenase
LEIARPGGRVLLFAHNDPVLKIEFPAAAVGIEEKEILGSYSASITEQEEYAQIVFERRLPLAQLVSDRFSTERISDALQLAEHPADNTLKVVITHS